jgi:hypothetical protein
MAAEMEKKACPGDPGAFHARMESSIPMRRYGTAEGRS